jgi:8-oxo-dGTP pyrophosphatase MutT (NUDIX family)
VLSWLNQQLERHQDPVPPAFAALLDLPSDVRDAAHYLPGHLTASGFVVSPNHDALLLIHHAKLGRWLQPGGHIEAEDETLEAAARREIVEETGLENFTSLGFFDLDIHEIPARKEQPTHQHFDVRFAFQAETDEVRALDGVLAVAWVRFEDLSTVGTDDSVMRPVSKLLEQKG